MVMVSPESSTEIVTFVPATSAEPTMSRTVSGSVPPEIPETVVSNDVIRAVRVAEPPWGVVPNTPTMSLTAEASALWC